MTRIKIDLNNARFQEQLFQLEKQEASALLRTLRKILKMEWNDLHVDRGLKWEVVVHLPNKIPEKVYTFRFSQKYRALATRQGEYLTLLSLHTDHDSAYS